MKNYLILSALLSFNSAFAMIGGEKAIGTENNGIFQITVPSEGGDNTCTASKIGKNLILTSAHCFDGNNNVRTLGLNSLVESERNIKYQSLSVKNYNTHPSYDPSLEEEFGANVIDLLIIEIEPSPLFDRFQTLKMDFENVPQDTDVVFWGYGCQKNVDASEVYKPVKKFSRNTVQDRNALVGDFGVFTKQVLRTKNSIYKNMIPTSGADLDESKASLCAGDSGGPMTRNGKIVGVNNTYLGWDSTAEGLTESGKTYINLHTRISTAKTWILEKTLNK